MYIKISDLPDFEAKKLLLEAQELGVELSTRGLDGTSATLIGLARLLVQRGVLPEKVLDTDVSDA